MKYDITIIGSGPGGYVAALRCAQLGYKTALIEKYNTLGGTCLNVGCIPSKALLDSSEHYENATHNFKNHGIDITGEIKVNLKQMIDRKNGVIKQTCDGIDFLMKKNKVDVLKGVGSFVSKNKPKFTIKIVFTNGEEVGAIGSTQFINNLPSKDKIMVAINIDMIGWSRKKLEESTLTLMPSYLSFTNS